MIYVRKNHLYALLPDDTEIRKEIVYTAMHLFISFRLICNIEKTSYITVMSKHFLWQRLNFMQSGFSLNSQIFHTLLFCLPCPVCFFFFLFFFFLFLFFFGLNVNNSGSCFCFVLFCFVFFFSFFFLFFSRRWFFKKHKFPNFLLRIHILRAYNCSEIALGSSKVGVFSSVVVGAVMYEED